MFNSTTNTYQMKREILNFSNKISKHLSKPDKKFSDDMTYFPQIIQSAATPTMRRAFL